jgi:hypothetical protein
MADRPDPGNPWEGMSTGWAVTSYMIGGLFTFGLIGYLIDWLAGDASFTAVRDVAGVFTAIGSIIGAALAVYVVYLRFGAEDGQRL